MGRVLGTLLAFGLALLIGHFLVGALWRGRPRDLADRLIGLAAGFGLGMGIVAALDFLWVAVIGRASRGIVIMDLAVLAIVFLAHRLSHKPCVLVTGSSRVFGWASGSIALFFTVIALGIVGTVMLRAPDGAWDAIAIWNVHAKFLNASSTQGWKAVFDPIMELSHPDYPPLIPAAVARGWTYAGQSIPLVPMMLALGFTLALLTLITAAVASARGGILGALACAVLAASPIFLGTALSQYADMPLAFFFLLAVSLLHRADREHEPRPGLHVLAGLAAGMAALTKNEGALFVLALGAGRLLYLVLVDRSRRQLKSLVWLLMGMAPILCVLLFYKSFPPPNYFVAGGGKDFWKKLLSRPRALLIIDQLLDELGKPHSFSVGFVQRTRTWHWHFLAASSFVLLFGLDRRRLARRLSKLGLALVVFGLVADIVATRAATGTFGWHWPVAILAALSIVGLGFDLTRLRHPSFLAATATLVLVNAGYFVVYLLTPLDLRWQLMFSIERLVFHTMPLAIFVAFLAMASWRSERASVASKVTHTTTGP
jgi:hypothetical protein